MSITPTEGSVPSYFGAAAATASTAAGAAGATGAAAGSAPSDKDLFLKLMVTQLRNQDPMNPTDSSQFLAQTAQFTSLEKLEAVADQTAQALSAQMAFGASGLVGRSVTYVGADGAEATGTVASVRFTADGPLLDVGGQEVTLASLSRVTS